MSEATFINEEKRQASIRGIESAIHNAQIARSLAEIDPEGRSGFNRQYKSYMNDGAALARRLDPVERAQVFKQIAADFKGTAHWPARLRSIEKQATLPEAHFPI